MTRRRSVIFRFVQWLVPLALIAVLVFVVEHSLLEAVDPVEAAAALRLGDPEREVEPDPAASIELMEALLRENPRHLDAHLEIASAYQKMRALDRAIDHLKQALELAHDDGRRIQVLRRMISLLELDERYEEAASYAEQVVELQPNSVINVLRLGEVHYKGSLEAQKEVTRRFFNLDKSEYHQIVEERVEAFVTGIDHSSTADEVAYDLSPNATALSRRPVEEALEAAHERFERAFEELAPYADYPGFDHRVATAYAEVLERAGRYYEAKLEAMIALREKRLNVGTQRQFLGVIADCAEAVGDWEQAASAQERILDAYAAEDLDPPNVNYHRLFEARLAAGRYDWVIANAQPVMDEIGDDLLIRFTVAAALDQLGRTKEAAEAVNDTYVTVVLGRDTSMPVTFRSHPERRKRVALLAYRLFAELGDRRSQDALTYLVRNFPRDLELRRQLVELEIAAGAYEEAESDARSLLTRERRDRGDFDRWLHVSSLLSEQRRDKTLQEQAARRVDEVMRFRETIRVVTQQIESRGIKTARRAGELVSTPNVDLTTSDNPALWFAIVEELVARGEVVEARLQLRKLVSSFPEIQEFRFRLGRLLVREGLLEPALSEFLTVLEEIPSDTETLDLARRTYHALGRDLEASQLVNRLILEDPLGVGAILYGQQLLERGRPGDAQRLVERLVRWTDFEMGLDLSLVSARAYLAMEEYTAAEAILSTLSQQHPDSADVALLALDLGLERNQPGLVSGALAALRRLVTGFFPDQVADVASKLRAAGRYEDLLTLFDEQVRELPMAAPALREVAAAAKAVGELDLADEVLGRDTQPFALLDRFLLLCLQERVDEAGHRLRLDPGPLATRPIAELCLSAAGALGGRAVLIDTTPFTAIAPAVVQIESSPAEIELLDALLRLLPTVRDVDAVRPKLVLEQTRGLYPEIGDDLTRLVDVAREAPDTAESAMRSLLLMALAGRRPFWSEERRFLAERVLELVPELLWPVHVLAEADIVSGDVGAAIERLLEPVSRPAPDLTSLRLFSEAANALGEPTWAVAVLTKVAAEDLEAQLLLADALRVQGEHEKALALYKEYLLTHNGDLDALLGALQSIAARREEEGLVLLAQQALEWHPGDDELLRTIGSALFNLRDPGADAVALMESIFSEYEHSYLVGEALARTQLDDVERLEPTLELLYERMRDLPLYDPEVPESRLHAVILTRSARLARTAGLLELAREMNDVALLAGAVGMGQYRELAYIELEQGRIETARRYFDVIVFIDPSDRQSAMTLAQLDFEHFGNPTRAAEVIRRTYPTQAPPSAVTILAAELFLLGRVEDALNTFHRVRESPGVLDQTFRTVGLIAYASGLDELAVPLFMQFHRDAAEDAPGRARIEWLLEERLDAGPKRGKGNTAASG